MSSQNEKEIKYQIYLRNQQIKELKKELIYLREELLKEQNKKRIRKIGEKYE